MDAGIPEMLLVEGTSAVEEEALVGAFAGLMLAKELPPYGCINLEVYYLSSSCLMIALNTVKLPEKLCQESSCGLWVLLFVGGFLRSTGPSV